MSKTNCINCGAAKEVPDLQCPFCGTKYTDLTTLDLFHDNKLFVQLRGSNGEIKTAKAYITNTTLQMEPETTTLYSMDGVIHRHTSCINVRGSLDFTLYEPM